MTDYNARFNELIVQGRAIPVTRGQMGDCVEAEPFHAWFASALNLLELVFGKSSTLAERFQGSLKDAPRRGTCFQIAKGIFVGAAYEYARGFFKGLRREISEEFVVDLCLHAESLADDGHIESAAVLAAAALEDCFKRRVEELGIDTEDKTLSDYISILKSNSILAGASAKLASGFPKFRNAAMHADWAKVDKTEIRTITAFVKGFVV